MTMRYIAELVREDGSRGVVECKATDAATALLEAEGLLGLDDADPDRVRARERAQDRGHIPDWIVGVLVHAVTETATLDVAIARERLRLAQIKRDEFEFVPRLRITRAEYERRRMVSSTMLRRPGAGGK